MTRKQVDCLINDAVMMNLDGRMIFQPVMDGQKRKAVIKNSVAGWMHTQINHMHYFARGNIRYVLDASTEAVVMQKFDCLSCSFHPVSFREFRKFVKVEIICKVGASCP